MSDITLGSVLTVQPQNAHLKEPVRQFVVTGLRGDRYIGRFITHVVDGRRIYSLPYLLTADGSEIVSDMQRYTVLHVAPGEAVNLDGVETR